MSAQDQIILNNYSDDAQIKSYISNVLMPRVFHDIPLNVLNTGQFSVINEYMSQAIENLGFQASFYLNESFITKAVLADSIYAEAAIFNIGYSYANPSVCNFMLELRIDDIQKNATYNPDNGLYEFILDKNTKFNMENGSVYSLDYDILIQYQTIETASIKYTKAPAWNVQYTNMDEQNYCAVNKNPYILYRVSETWLCLFVCSGEYERQVHRFVNNMANGIPNADQVITCQNHIAGFDVKYIDGDGNEQYLDRDHILPIHSDVKDQSPYIHYIMDNPQTIRFKFQMNGNRYFVPQVNSVFEVTVYTCHGEAANFTAFKADEQPTVITSSNRYSNNGNVLKAAFVMSGSQTGTNIGTIETVRRETIQAYNTANVISSDHDIEEWFKTFFFKNILYPYFFKRRDDPWGRIWSGFFALKDVDGKVFRTNTLTAEIPYTVLYNNNDNLVSNNEIIIPPGWAWSYQDDGTRHTVRPIVDNSGGQVETAKTAINTGFDFVFANPFGIRIQKSPFAIGYFNPWVNQDATASLAITNIEQNIDPSDISIIYHATPTYTNIRRTYQDDFYKLSVMVSPTTMTDVNGENFVKHFRSSLKAPTFSEEMWNYFEKPADLFSSQIPVLVLQESDQYIVFNPEKTYLCVKDKTQMTDDPANRWILANRNTTHNYEDFNHSIWIEDDTDVDQKRIPLQMNGISVVMGDDAIWGENGLCKGYEVMVSGDTDINMYPVPTEDSSMEFTRSTSQNYYQLRITDQIRPGRKIISIIATNVFETDLTRYGEEHLWRIGYIQSYDVRFKVTYDDGSAVDYTIQNANAVYAPYTPIDNNDGTWTFDLSEVDPGGVLLYADMKPTASDAAVAYYRVPLSLILKNVPIFYMTNTDLNLTDNDLRVVLLANINGQESGHIEMQPVSIESDGSVLFDTIMFPLNKLVDVDNRIQIASINRGGGSWIPVEENSTVSIDATTPELQVVIMFRSSDENLSGQPVEGYTGYRVADIWNLNNITLVQELKEMRSVTTFGEDVEPSAAQVASYEKLMNLQRFSEEKNLWTIKQYAYHKINSTTDESGITFDEIKTTASVMAGDLSTIIEMYRLNPAVPDLNVPPISTLVTTLQTLAETTYEGDVDWTTIWNLIDSYPAAVDEIYSSTSIHSSVKIQLVPFVESSLMESDRFESFVASFTQVHKAIEPVIFDRLEGNNYLDCKLIATYGLPHSYVADVDKDRGVLKFWPDLSVQIRFDVKLYNPALESNTINELRAIIKSYFNRLTTVHTPVDMISLDNNIYISQLIKLLEEHPNVTYLKYRGFYTNEQNVPGGKYMNSEYQGIVQAWDTLDDMPHGELMFYVPEMFVLDDENIELNIL